MVIAGGTHLVRTVLALLELALLLGLLLRV
jgi:hypothetical protein